MARTVIMIDDEELDDEGNPVQFDITDEFNDIVTEHVAMEKYLEQVTASFEEEAGISLSDEASELILARASGESRAGSTPRPSPGASSASATLKKAKSSTAAGTASAKLKRSVASKFAANTASPKHASLGKHLMHAAKVVGRFAGKNKTALAVAGSAAVGGAVGARVASAVKKRNIEASQDDLVLDDEEFENEEVEFEEYTQEELDAMTPEQAEELLQEELANLSEEEVEELESVAAEEERQTGLQEFARTALVRDAESRTPAKAK